MGDSVRFRLEAIRGLRRRQRDEQRRRLATALNVVRKVDDRLTVLSQQLRDSTVVVRAAQDAGPLDLNALRGSEFLRGWLQRRILESQEERAMRSRDVERERAVLADAVRRFKVIEKLRERHEAEWHRRLRRVEQMAQDEAAVQVTLNRPE